MVSGIEYHRANVTINVKMDHYQDIAKAVEASPERSALADPASGTINVMDGGVTLSGVVRKRRLS